MRAIGGRAIPAGAPGRAANPRPMSQKAPFTWDVPAGFNFARDVVDALAREDRRGLLFVDAAGKQHDYSFEQIADRSKRWAAVLRDAGVKKGDRVVVVLPKIPDWLFCMTALLRIGAVAVPSAEQLRAKDLLYRANHSGATTVVAHASNAAEFDAMRADAQQGGHAEQPVGDLRQHDDDPVALLHAGVAQHGGPALRAVGDLLERVVVLLPRGIDEEQPAPVFARERVHDVACEVEAGRDVPGERCLLAHGPRIRSTPRRTRRYGTPSYRPHPPRLQAALRCVPRARRPGDPARRHRDRPRRRIGARPAVRRAVARRVAAGGHQTDRGPPQRPRRAAPAQRLSVTTARSRAGRNAAARSTASY